MTPLFGFRAVPCSAQVCACPVLFQGPVVGDVALGCCSTALLSRFLWGMLDHIAILGEQDSRPGEKPQTPEKPLKGLGETSR